MSDHILKNIPVLFDLSFETQLFVICMRIISLQNLATKVVVTRKGWLKSYLKSITTPAPIPVDRWYSQTGALPSPLRYPRICGAQIVTSRTITVPFSHRPPPWLLGSLSIFNGYLTCPPRPTFRNSPLTYTAGFEGFRFGLSTHPYCILWAGIPKHGHSTSI